MKNEIIWVKIYWHDSSFFSINHKDKQLTAFSIERFTRIKHDRASVLKILNWKNKSNLVHSFSSINKQVLNEKILLHDIYDIFNINYIKDLIELNIFVKIWKLFFIKPKLLLIYLLNYLKLYNNHYYKYSLEYKEHHLCHWAASYYFSDFNKEESIVFTLDWDWDNKYSTLYKYNNLEREKIS